MSTDLSRQTKIDQILLEALPVENRLIMKPHGRFSQPDEETKSVDINAGKRRKAKTEIKALLQDAYTRGKRDGKSVATFNVELERLEKEAHDNGRRAEIEETRKVIREAPGFLTIADLDFYLNERLNGAQQIGKQKQ